MSFDFASLPQRFNAARESGDLIFFPSTITTHADADAGVEFEIRLCPALQKKPPLGTAQEEGSADKDAAKADPFMPPYNERLYLGDIQDDESSLYSVLLNKFPMIPEHFLLVTREFHSQSSPLTPSDLVLIHKILTSAKKVGRKFMAFYNCGANSGASQTHKHIQFIPIEENDPPIERLAKSANLEKPDKPFSLSRLSYSNHIFRLPSDLLSLPRDRLELALSGIFLSLLDLAITAIRHDPEYPAGRPSYNVLLTTEHMHLIPRRQEAYAVPSLGTSLGINSLGFAGYLMAKSDEELDVLKQEGISKVLAAVGLKSTGDEDIQE